MTQTCVRQSDLGATKHTPMVRHPLVLLNPTINTKFSCGKCEKVMVVQQLVPGTKTSSFTLLSFLAQLPTKMRDFPPKKLSQSLPFYPLFSKLHHILGVLELENLFFCCSPLHAFFSCLKNSLFTPLVSKMLQNDTIFLFVLRGFAIRNMQQRNSLQLHTASEHSETSKNRM